jgi:class 3 adenylate cyclase
MIPGSKEIEKWMLHIVGKERLDPGNRHRLEEAVELNENAPEVISTFGKKEFHAAIGFLDMRGFSKKSAGKTPTQILSIAKPFVDCVIEVAGKRHWIIDKTMGDEVMLLFPEIGTDAKLALPQPYATNGPAFLEAITLIADILIIFRQKSIEDKFTSGFAIGNICLDRVGVGPYSEWTCYGNAVNTAKRLQSAAAHSKGVSSNYFAIGASLNDYPKIDKLLDTWEQISSAVERVDMIAPVRKFESLKGVGKTSYIVSAVGLKKGF